MPTKMDFETKYKAADAQPFDQKQDMFKRVRWDPELQELGREFFGVVTPQEKAGYRHEDFALRNAGWFLRMGFAKEQIQDELSLYNWEDRRVGLCKLPEDLTFDAKDPEYNTTIIKTAAKIYGACDVGICKMDRRWLYSKAFEPHLLRESDIHIPDDYQYVINIAVSMKYLDYKYTPTASSGGTTGLGYSKMAFTAGLTAQFVRQLGYKAIPSGNDTALSIPLAIQSGLGELGRNGFLITPKYGPRVRLCKIITNLPLVCDDPIEFGVSKFCDVCKQCAKHCPSQAISYGERTTEALNRSNAGGPLKWYVNGEKCFRFWAKNGSECGNCIRVCPFNKPEGILHDLSRWFIERVPQLNPVYVIADDFFGYSKQADLETFWHRKR